MMLLCVGLAILLAIHLLPANKELRDGLVARFGVVPYKVFFSLVSLAGLVLIVVGYGKMQALVGSKNPILWYPPEWTKHVALVLMLPAMVLLVASVVPSHIRSLVKHPLLVGVKIWALAHLMANGTLAALVLFGALLAYAVFDRISVKRRGEVVAEPPTSYVNDVIVVLAGLALYAGLLTWGHELLIGKALLT